MASRKGVSNESATTSPASSVMKREMTFDFDGLIQLLAGHLYSEKKVFIRELVQNAHDAIQLRSARDPLFDREQGRIDVLTDLTIEPGRIIFRDNGLGMTRDDLETFLSTIGKSGTRVSSVEAPDMIGQFGIGFLSGFVVGGRVEVRTRHWQAAPTEACVWENDGRKDYTITPHARDLIGTEVIVNLRSAEDRGLLHDDAVKKVIRDYADMLRIPIFLNDPQHSGASVNTRVMPWERVGISEREMRLDCMVYLEKTMPDSVLEVIPVLENGVNGVHAEGLLYITRTRVLKIDAPRTIRVFQKRMFVCEDAKELLPPWATFVNGIINTRDLSPNAARDNFTRDSAFYRLRDRLGDVIVAHLEQLKEREPQRLSQILAYHDLGIKAACHYYAPFFDKFGHLLEWRINGRSTAARETGRPAGRRALSEDLGVNYAWATLPDILAALPAPNGGGPKRLSCFTSSTSANQFIEMADAAETTVVDATYPFEDDLIKAWADSRKAEVSLVYVDREDDPAVFREIDAEYDGLVRDLARTMSTLMRLPGTGRLRVEARRFEPITLPAVIKDTDAGRGTMKARSILSDPNSVSDLRAMAEEMLRLSRNADMRMTINAGNTLIRTLAALVADDPDDADLHDLMRGIYNDAILYNQELMTPQNAQVFHEQFQRLMGRSLEFVKQKADLARERLEIDKERQQRRPALRTSRRHLVAFLMTPFATEFDVTREALRRVVEDRFGCELRTADQKTFEDFIRGNVEAHLGDADVFIADVSGANPNVMLELGAALYGRQGEPTLLVVRVDQEGEKPALPADLGGHIAATYVRSSDIESIVSALEDGLRKNHRLTTLMDSNSRERYVAPELVKRILQPTFQLPDEIYRLLSEALPTATAWKAAEAAQVSRVLGQPYEDLSLPVLKRVRESL